MRLTDIQTVIMILAVTVGTVITRFLPFVLFPENKNPHKFVIYLGRTLPPAMMGLLVVYSLKDITPLTFPYGLPELIAVSVILILHLWKNNTLLSICGGTAVYMFLVQKIFL